MFFHTQLLLELVNHCNLLKETKLVSVQFSSMRRKERFWRLKIMEISILILRLKSSHVEHSWYLAASLELWRKERNFKWTFSLLPLNNLHLVPMLTLLSLLSQVLLTILLLEGLLKSQEFSSLFTIMTLDLALFWETHYQLLLILRLETENQHPWVLSHSSKKALTLMWDWHQVKLSYRWNTKIKKIKEE